MSSFGLIEENMELSHILLAVSQTVLFSKINVKELRQIWDCLFQNTESRQ
jgi:hypothetical protein